MQQDDKYLALLRTYWKRHSAFPPMAKLCAIVGLSSTSSVFALVGRLSDAGYLERTEGRIAPTKKFFARPLLSPVRAGLAQPVSQEEPELVTVDDYLIDEPNRTSMHRVRGDSMRDAGLYDGDLLAVEHNTPTKPGDIVVACVDNELTVKTLCLDGQGRYFLEAANPAYAAIHPKTSLEVLGVVVGLVRRLRT
jgi:repressor LexA